MVGASESTVASFQGHVTCPFYPLEGLVNISLQLMNKMQMNYLLVFNFFDSLTHFSTLIPNVMSSLSYFEKIAHMSVV